MKRKNHFLKATIVALSTITIISIFFMNYTTKKEKNQRYETYVVKQGDTLWSIAKKTNPDKDPRKVIFEIREINNITPIIYPGQEILIPVVDRNVD